MCSPCHIMNTLLGYLISTDCIMILFWFIRGGDQNQREGIPGAGLDCLHPLPSPACGALMDSGFRV